jgi:hypothetical protein
LTARVPLAFNRVRCSDIFDVYVDKAFRVWLLDFGPFSFVTDSLLFSHLRDFAPLLRAQRAGLPLPPTLSSQASSSATSGSDATPSISETVPSSSPASVPPSAMSTASSSAASTQQWFEFEFRIVASQQSVVPSNTMHYRLPKEIIEMSNAADV